MTAEAVGAKLNLKLTNLMAGEHLTPEYLAVSSSAFECTFHAKPTPNVCRIPIEA